MMRDDFVPRCRQNRSRKLSLSQRIVRVDVQAWIGRRTAESTQPEVSGLKIGRQHQVVITEGSRFGLPAVCRWRAATAATIWA